MMSRDFSVHFGLYVCSLVLNNHTHDYICVSYQKSCTYNTYRGAGVLTLFVVHGSETRGAQICCAKFMSRKYMEHKNNVPDLPVGTYNDSFYVPVRSGT